jgi:hypothetical protein
MPGLRLAQNFPYHVCVLLAQPLARSSRRPNKLLVHLRTQPLQCIRGRPLQASRNIHVRAHAHHQTSGRQAAGQNCRSMKHVADEPGHELDILLCHLHLHPTVRISATSYKTCPRLRELPASQAASHVVMGMGMGNTFGRETMRHTRPLVDIGYGHRGTNDEGGRREWFA